MRDHLQKSLSLDCQSKHAGPNALEREEVSQRGKQLGSIVHENCPLHFIAKCLLFILANHRTTGKAGRAAWFTFITSKACLPKKLKVKSPSFSFFNHEWRVQIYPGSSEESDDGMVGIFLQHRSGSEISCKFQFLIRNTSGMIIKEKLSSEHRMFSAENETWGWKDFTKRSNITDPPNEILKDGTLTVEVRIQPDEDHCCLNFIPRNKFAQNMLRSFLDEVTSDVVFELKGQDKLSSTSVLVHAHKVVLQFCAKGSTLAALCEECDKSTPVPIEGVDPHIFRRMLLSIYGGIVTASEWKDHAKDFIDAADRYGVKNFKIEAEAWYVSTSKSQWIM